jgi:hypothetical protein
MIKNIIYKIIFTVFFFLKIMMSTNLNQLQGTKKLGQRCNWRAIGTECFRGLTCSKRYGVCLKKDGEQCTKGDECVGRKCRRNKCH